MVKECNLKFLSKGVGMQNTFSGVWNWLRGHSQKQCYNCAQQFWGKFNDDSIIPCCSPSCVTNGLAKHMQEYEARNCEDCGNVLYVKSELQDPQLVCDGCKFSL